MNWAHRLTVLALSIPFAMQMAAAQTGQERTQRDTAFARYVMIKDVSPGTANGCQETYTDEHGLLEQLLICSGEPNRETTFSPEMSLSARHPHRLVEFALDEITKGAMTGERALVDGTTRHHVRWKASSRDAYEIEETLSR